MAEIKRDPIMDAQQTSLGRDLDKIANIKAGKMVESQALYNNNLNQKFDILINEINNLIKNADIIISDNKRLTAQNKKLYEALKAVLASVICNGDFTVKYAIDKKIRGLIDKAVKDYEAK
jgi:predicted GTPase